MDEFELTLKGDGISVQRSVDRATALAILNTVLGRSPDPSRDHLAHGTQREMGGGENDRVPPQESLRTTPSERPEPPMNEKPVSLREFVNECEPKTNAQTILCIAQYISQHENIHRFRRDAIRPKFAAAGEQVPKNFPRDFQTAIDKGWIGEDPQNRNHYFVTRTGEAQLTKGLKVRRNSTG